MIHDRASWRIGARRAALALIIAALPLVYLGVAAVHAQSIMRSPNTQVQSFMTRSVLNGAQFSPEKIQNYELGLKSDWLDHTLRFNITGYYYHYTNSCTSGEADNTLCHGRLPFGPFHPAPGSDDVVLVAGHHFMVIVNGGVTLHYMFSSQSEQPNSPPAAGTTAPTPALAPSPAPTSAPTPTPTPATATTLQTSPWPWYLCTSRLAHCRSQTWAFSTKTVLCG